MVWKWFLPALLCAVVLASTAQAGLFGRRGACAQGRCLSGPVAINLALYEYDAVPDNDGIGMANDPLPPPPPAAPPAKQTPAVVVESHSHNGRGAFQGRVREWVRSRPLARFAQRRPILTAARFVFRGGCQ